MRNANKKIKKKKKKKFMGLSSTLIYTSEHKQDALVGNNLNELRHSQPGRGVAFDNS